MNVSEIQLGQLKCRQVDALPEGGAPQHLVVLCHGFGAPGEDLVPIGPEVLTHSKILSEKVRFVFPQGPLSLEGFGMWGARAWWELDLEKLNAALASGQNRNLTKDLPQGLPQARSLLQEALDVLLQQTGLSFSNVFLGGFSQGSMLACDVGLRLQENVAGLVLWSSTLLSEDQWQELAPARKGLPVLQSHGRQDPLLPFDLAQQLRDLLNSSGLEVEFHPFDGEHTISMPVMTRFVSWLEEKIS